ncbi:MXAN_2562 family outer membrane beta-barrel protein [Geomesophilobacter sediminis]|uniref:Outer membrane beta-barrel protein n=1 Tax=Geomesophilobacter sediminis TaxID=2798584 RepID=A0A8J7M4N1_9BACT|nr:MXAN_2562 family outer membrane beta-barrel protein [Geomesophilobacter sediminis]MBJ6727878.1 outer membrane beta-barrel protein [Geomesophilobacter sediminis]
MRKLILAIVLLLLSAPAFAAEAPASRPHWSLEFKGGAFFPDAGQWSTFYGQNYTSEFGAALAYKVTRNVEVGLEASYMHASGKGTAAQSTGSTPVVTGDTARMEIVPLDLFVLFRGVFDEKQWLVPYAGGGYTRLFYRQNATGSPENRGSTNGFHARAGLQFLLDRIDPDAAKSAAKEVGLQHTYFFVEGKYLRAVADTVPSGTVNLGGVSTLGGLLFEF